MTPAQEQGARAAAACEPRPRVFISYARADDVVVSALAEGLARLGVEVFRDTQDILPTEAWKARIEELVAAADTVAFCISAHALDSEVCQWEIDLALRLGKRLAPVRIGSVGNREVPPALARLNYVVMDRPGQIAGGVERLVAALTTDIGWVREHTRLGQLAQRWDDERSASRLLRGRDLEDAEAWLTRQPAGAAAPTDAHGRYIRASRLAASRRQRLAIGGALMVAAATAALAGFAIYQGDIAARNAELAAQQQRLAEDNEREARRALAFGDIREAADHDLTDPGRALAHLARAVRSDPGVSFAGRRALHIIAENAFPVPLPGWTPAPFVAQRERVLDGPGVLESADGSWAIRLGKGEVMFGRGAPRSWRPLDGECWSGLRVAATPARTSDFAAIGCGITSEFGNTGRLKLVGAYGHVAFDRQLAGDLVTDLGFDPAGTLLQVSTMNGDEALYGVVRYGTYFKLARLATLSGTFSADGRSLVVGDQRLRLRGRMLDEKRVAADEAVRWRDTAYDAPVASPDGRLSATATRSRSNVTIRVVSTPDGAPVIEPLVVDEQHAGFLFGRDGSWIATYGYNSGSLMGEFRMIDLETGLPLIRPRRYAGPFAERADGRRVYVGGGAGEDSDVSGDPLFFDVLGAPGPVPPWVADLAEGVGGQHLDQRGLPAPLGVQARLRRLEAVQEAVAGERESRWAEFARWYLDVGDDATLSPYSTRRRR